jgi:hypothetical protein
VKAIVMRRFLVGARSTRSAPSVAFAALGVAALIASTVAGCTKLAPQQAEAPAAFRPDDQSCFLQQIAHPQATTIERATVFIAFARADGTLLSQGTGFVVAGSTVAGSEGLRIVTAAHVVSPRDHEADAYFIAFFSDGMSIGKLRVVASGPVQDIALGDSNLVANDIAVLEIAHFATANAQERFSQLEGLPIASSDTVLVGETSTPYGAAWGFSGAAAIDPAGNVIGVLTGADFHGRLTLDLGSVHETNAAGKLVNRAVTLPTQSLVVVEPLNSPEILKALAAPPARRVASTVASVVMAGFPLASCASVTARLESADSSTGAALLSKWQKIGQVADWIFPPPFDAKKLKLD